VPTSLTDPTGKIVPLIIIIPVIAGVINGASNALKVSMQCDATYMDLIRAFGYGAVGGVAGSLVGIGIGALTSNPYLAGASGGLTADIITQYLTDGTLDPIDLTLATVSGGAFGKAASTAIKTTGRLPSMMSPRPNYGPNSIRLMEQEAAAGVAGASLQNVVNAVRACPCP
jgi:hypothetical protein